MPVRIELCNPDGKPVQAVLLWRNEVAVFAVGKDLHDVSVSGVNSRDDVFTKGMCGLVKMWRYYGEDPVQGTDMNGNVIKAEEGLSLHPRESAEFIPAEKVIEIRSRENDIFPAKRVIYALSVRQGQTVRCTGVSTPKLK